MLQVRAAEQVLRMGRSAMAASVVVTEKVAAGVAAAEVSAAGSRGGWGQC